jgi:hydroxymethylpyrimidine kinase/phosphomethylpyrimidine kinase/thiamine-phosphate diphosphorylase
LYAVVDSADRLQQVLDAGIRTVQLRLKTPEQPTADWPHQLRQAIARCITCARQVDAELFINDHAELALELGAPGIHLGQEDLLALSDEARSRIIQSAALGISSHSLWELCRASTLHPRYIACGPVWPTTTKAMPWLPQGLDNLSWWSAMAPRPVVAIGGILEAEQVLAAARSGADGVCVVRGLGDHPAATVPALQLALEAGHAAPRFAVEWPHASRTTQGHLAGALVVDNC